MVRELGLEPRKCFKCIAKPSSSRLEVCVAQTVFDWTYLGCSIVFNFPVRRLKIQLFLIDKN